MPLFQRGKSGSAPARMGQDTVIGPGTSVQGSIRCDGNVRLEGALEGTLEATGEVIIGESGRVIGDIFARSIIVAGAVKGNLHAEESVDITPTGKVWGDIATTNLRVDEGLFQGRSITKKDVRPESVLMLEAPKEEASSLPSEGEEGAEEA